jgi:hypothetical protein
MKKYKATQGFEWAFRDLLIALVVVYMAFAVIALTVNTNKKVQEDPLNGPLIIEMFWPPESNVDMDLWVKAPDEPVVYYQQKTGKSCDLVRDDLGHYVDTAPRGMEMVICRNKPPGEYIINVHSYDEHAIGDHTEYPIKVRVRVRKLSGQGYIDILDNQYREIVIDHTHQEVTAFRFKLDENGNLITESVNHLYRPIIYEKVSQP